MSHSHITNFNYLCKRYLALNYQISQNKTFMLISGLKKFFSLVANPIDLNLLIQVSGRKLIMPFYHTVSDAGLPHIKNLYPVIGTQQFKSDLDFFQKHYKAINPDYLIKLVHSGKEAQEKTFFLSFDDGLREFHDVVVPILLERGIPATCFVNPAFVDNKDMFFRLKVSVIVEKLKVKTLTPGQKKIFEEFLLRCGISFQSPNDLFCITDRNKFVLDDLAACLDFSFPDYLAEHQPYLTTAQIESLINKGFTIGSHSYNHLYYPSISEKEQLQETLDGMNWVNEHFSPEKKMFAFPYTDFQVKKSFFEQIEHKIDLSFGTANLKKDCIETNFQRVPMEIEGRTTAEKLVKTEYVYYILKRMLGKHLIIRN